jgi:hypothetical protein
LQSSGFTHKCFGESNLFNDRVSVAGCEPGEHLKKKKKKKKKTAASSSVEEEGFVEEL